MGKPKKQKIKEADEALQKLATPFRPGKKPGIKLALTSDRPWNDDERQVNFLEMQPGHVVALSPDAYRPEPRLLDTRVIEDALKTLEPSSFSLYCYLYISEGGYLLLKDIETFTRLSLATVKRAMRDLRQKNLVRIVDRKPQTGNRYEVARVSRSSN